MKWIAKIRRDPGPDFRISSKTKVCSNHFTPEDFTSGSTDEYATRRVLKKTAVASIFSWSNTKSSQCTTRTSQRAKTEIRVPVNQQPAEGSLTLIDDFEISDQTVEDINDPGCDSIESLQAKVEMLSSLQVTELQAKYENSLFRLANIKHDDEEVKFYTGFSNYDTLFYFFKNILESDAMVMRQWSGRQSKESYKVVEAANFLCLSSFF